MEKIFIICGPSGVGKSSIIKGLPSNWQNNSIVKIKSYTTRAQRNSDDNYKFIKEMDFQKKINNNFFFEYNKVFNNFYGKSYEDLQQKGIKILDLDILGVSYYKKNLNFINKKPIIIAIEPPNIETLKARVLNRDGILQEDRINRIQEEIAYGKKANYIIKNKTLSKSIEKLQNILKKEYK